MNRKTAFLMSAGLSVALLVSPTLTLGAIQFMVAIIVSRIAALCIAEDCRMPLFMMLTLVFIYNSLVTWKALELGESDPNGFVARLIGGLRRLTGWLPRYLQPVLLLVAAVPQVGMALSVAVVGSWQGSRLRRAAINGLAITIGFLIWTNGFNQAVGDNSSARNVLLGVAWTVVGFVFALKICERVPRLQWIAWTTAVLLQCVRAMVESRGTRLRRRLGGLLRGLRNRRRLAWFQAGA